MTVLVLLRHGESAWNAKDLCRPGCVLVVSHGNTLRALVKHLEGVSDDASSGLNVPNAVPVRYGIAAGHATRLA